MKIRHFVLDSHTQLRKFSRQAVHEILAGRVSAQAFDAALDREMVLATVVCDDDLIPTNVYLLRVPLTEGVFTARDKMVLRTLTRPECVTPNEAARHHLTGWPSDLLRQLAVALDVPVAGLDRVLDVGGPVLFAALHGVSVTRAMRDADPK